MAYHAVVTQAPHASFRNGGESANARQYFARRSQRVNNGPRIAPAIAGIAPGEFRTIWANNANEIFRVRLPSTNGGFDILDWTPHAVWDAPTQQILIGGRRGLTKLIAYADLVGDWREMAMPADLGRLVSGTVHYYGRIARNPLTGVTYFGSSESTGKTWAYNPVTEQYTRLADHPTANGGNGASMEWAADTERLVLYVGDADRWCIYNPGTNTWTNPFNGLGNGQHAILRYHPTHARHLLIGGSETLRRAMLVTSAGVATLVTDCPADVTMGNAASSYAIAHPAGCWLVRANTGTEHRIYAAWPNPGLTDVTWQDLGTAPDNGLADPTAAPGYSEDIILITAASGLYAWRLPTLGPTTISAGVGEAVATGLAATITLGTATTIAAGVGEAAASGLQAAIAVGTTIAAGVGSAAATGLQAAIAVSVVISGGVGSADASGLPAAIRLGSNVTIAGQVGTAAASGLPASIATSTVIAAGVGAAEASGLQAAITLATGSTTAIAAGVGQADASGLPATITASEPTMIAANVGTAEAVGLRAIIRALGLLPAYLEQPTTGASWSYKQTATLWRLVARDEWGGQTTHELAGLFLCDYAADDKQANTARGSEYVTRLMVYTSLPGIRRGDMVKIGATNEADPYKAGAHEVLDAMTYADTFRAEEAPDFRIVT